jgi:membrane protein implicated in regulation of membrane protease activity
MVAKDSAARSHPPLMPPDPVGQMILEGARWRARRIRTDDGEQLQAGDSVVVASVADLTVWVRRAADLEVSR